MPEALAFSSLHLSHRPAILRFLRRMVGETDAEDLTQVVFERANRALPEFRGECSASTWLYRIATNVALDLLRSPTFRRRDASLTDIVEPDHDVQAAPTPTIEQEAIRNEMNACIRETIDDLPVNDRVVLVLADIEGYGAAEVAERLGLGLEATKMRLHRARGRLRQRLEGKCQFYQTELGDLACDRRQDEDS